MPLTVSDDCYLLSDQVICPIPPCRVHKLALIVSQAWDRLWPLRLIELADAADEEVTSEFVFRTELCVLASLCSSHLYLPLLGVLVPSPALDSAVEPNMWIQIVSSGNRDEILENLFLTGILTRPILQGVSMTTTSEHRCVAVYRILGKRVAVELGPDIAAASRVLVVVPGAWSWFRRVTLLAR